MSKKIEMTPAQSESKEKLFAEAYDYYAKHYFNINDFVKAVDYLREDGLSCLLYTSPSPRDVSTSRMPSSA